MNEGIIDSLDQSFLTAVRSMVPGSSTRATSPPGPDSPIREGSTLTRARALIILEAQMTSRHLDFAARRLRERGQGYYTISSAGHEGNAAVAEALAPTDPALLHYRSGAFFVQRARQASEVVRAVSVDPIRDVLLGVVAARDEPIAGGRHKVFGSVPLAIWPQTSTIASHLPKAVGMAFASERKKRLGLLSRGLGRPDHVGRTQQRSLLPEFPTNSIVVCSFGDASINHSTAVGAINTACLCTYQRLPVPVLFVCEDNGIGISVRTPGGWIAATHRNRTGLRYFHGDGCDLVATYETARQAVAHVRSTRTPAFLHLSMVRFLGHAGADVELAYRDPDEIRGDLLRDPLIASARILIEAGVLTSEEVIAAYQRIQGAVASTVEEVAGAPGLQDTADVMSTITMQRPDAVEAEVQWPIDGRSRARLWGAEVPENDGPLPLAGHINRALGDLLARYPEVILFGEDIGRKGGVYGVTRGLQNRAGMARVFDTLLDEQAILGLAIGAGQSGLLPIPEIQYLAYVHNAIDQLRGEAATLQFFSQGQFMNPMVVRIAAFAYQKGFGGHFHNDNSVAALCDIPGLVIAVPSRGDDATALLRTCVAAARIDGRVCIFLEPIALYNTRDLYHVGDGLLATPYRPDSDHVPIGSARLHGEGNDLLLISFANGAIMSLAVARHLAETYSIGCRVLDLRWLAPLPAGDLLYAARQTRNVIVVDETRQTGGVSERIITALLEGGFSGNLRRVTSRDSFIPLGPAADHVLPGQREIITAALAMLNIAQR